MVVLTLVPPSSNAPKKFVNEKHLVIESSIRSFLDVGKIRYSRLIPGVGEIADGANGLIYTARGDALNAGLSFSAMIPVAGWVATGGKKRYNTRKK